jgi:hypothetical protein
VSRAPTTKVVRAEPRPSACCQRGGPVFSLPFSALRSRRPLDQLLIAPRMKHEGDDERQAAEDDVLAGPERHLRRLRQARMAQGEDDDEAERDAGHRRAAQVAEQQPLGVRQQQHHRRRRKQRRVEGCEECEKEDVAHGKMNLLG